MPGSIVHDIGWSIDHLVQARIKQQRFLYDHSAKDRTVPMDSPMILVDRASFDQHFVERALKLGQGRVQLRQNANVMDVVQDKDGVTLVLKSGQSIRARYVIAADGASSRVARAIGLYARAAGAGIDALVETGPETFETERNRVTFNVHCVRDGYGWIFPKDDHLSCGVGIWRDPDGLVPAMDDFLARSLPPDDILHVTRLAHPVPVFTGHRQIATERVCLVGDAAHLVDPVLGEGIKYAIQSGQLAADVVAQLLQPHRVEPARPTGTDDSFSSVLSQFRDCFAYGHILRHTIGRQLNLIRLQDESFFTSPQTVYQAIIG